MYVMTRFKNDFKKSRTGIKILKIKQINIKDAMYVIFSTFITLLRKNVFIWGGESKETRKIATSRPFD